MHAGCDITLPRLNTAQEGHSGIEASVPRRSSQLARRGGPSPQAQPPCRNVPPTASAAPGRPQQRCRSLRHCCRRRRSQAWRLGPRPARCGRGPAGTSSACLHPGRPAVTAHPGSSAKLPPPLLCQFCDFDIGSARSAHGRGRPRTTDRYCLQLLYPGLERYAVQPWRTRVDQQRAGPRNQAKT